MSWFGDLFRIGSAIASVFSPATLLAEEVAGDFILDEVIDEFAGEALGGLVGGAFGEFASESIPAVFDIGNFEGAIPQIIDESWSPPTWIQGAAESVIQDVATSAVAEVFSPEPPPIPAPTVNRSFEGDAEPNNSEVITMDEVDNWDLFGNEGQVYSDSSLPTVFTPGFGDGMQQVAFPSLGGILGGIAGAAGSAIGGTARAAGVGLLSKLRNMVGGAGTFMINGVKGRLKDLWPAVRKYGPEATAAALGVSVATLGQMLMAAPRGGSTSSRRRGISYRDIHTTRRVVNFTNKMQKTIGCVSRPRFSRSRSRRK